MQNEIKKIIDQMNLWIEKNGWAGYDPYDIKENILFLKLQIHTNNIFIKGIRKFLFIGLDFFPNFFRIIFGIKKKVNAKGMGLFAWSYIKLFKLYKEKKYLDKYHECIAWLVNNNHSKSNKYLAWGYPFNWQSLIMIPKETPLCTATVMVGHAMLEEYELFKDKKTAGYLERIKNYFIDKLNRTYFDNNKMFCFSYSPIDDFLIINANLYTASFLTRYAILFKDKETLKIARQARNFSISQQEKSGAWPYWSDYYKIKFKRWVDNYHMGVNLLWLAISSRYDKNSSNDKKSMQKGADYFIKTFFQNNGLPRMHENKTYPVDIHSPAQAFVTFNYLKALIKPDLVKKVFYFTIGNLYDKKGYFYYRVYKSGRKSKIPFIRWGQSWMLFGLVNLLEYYKK